MRSYLPPWAKTMLRPYYHAGFRALLRARCCLHDLTNSTYNRDNTIPPAMIRFRVGESIDSAEFLSVGKGCAGIIEENIRTSGIVLSEGMKVLDFGCGCGRVLRWLLPQAPSAEFYGVDVDKEAIAWCTENLRAVRFQATSHIPPLPFPDNYFDVIYCISVFTHLDERMQDIWIEELRRILVPKGTLLFTVHGAVETEVLAGPERDRLAANGFLCHHSRKLKGIMPDWYGVSWHTEKYVASRASRWFSSVQYRVIPNSGQDLVVCRND